MAQWKFQILPTKRGLLGTGFRMDATGQAVEDEVNDALPNYFRFHKISKVVLFLGPYKRDFPDYLEELGVAQKQFPEFNLEAYAAAAADEKEEQLRSVVRSAFSYFEQNFDEALFVEVARRKLEWA